MKKDYFTEDELEQDDADVYFDRALGRLTEDDVLSGEEEGFMAGYLHAYG
ncbi:MAG: hypothetical protein AABY01_00925 [Nanoarchaeota archaeon]